MTIPPAAPTPPPWPEQLALVDEQLDHDLRAAAAPQLSPTTALLVQVVRLLRRVHRVEPTNAP